MIWTALGQKKVPSGEFGRSVVKTVMVVVMATLMLGCTDSEPADGLAGDAADDTCAPDHEPDTRAVSVLASDAVIAAFDTSHWDVLLQESERAIAIDPCYALAYGDRGFAYYGLGQFEKAVDDYDEAIRLGANESFVFSNRALAHHELGQFDEAIEDYDEAIRLDPTDEFLKQNRANAIAEAEAG